MNLQPIPINTAAWAIGGLVIFVYCARLYNQYLRTNNYLSRLLLLFFLVLAGGFLVLSLPVFFTQDPLTVRWAYLAGDALRLSALVLMGRVFWFFSLQKRINFWWIGSVSIGLGAAAIIHEFIAFHPYVVGNLVILEYPLLSSIAQFVQLSVFGLGLGGTFIWQGVKELRQFGKVQAAIKSISLGIGFAMVPGSVAFNNLINQGGETFVTSLVIMAGFLIALLGLELPAVRRALPPEPATEPYRAGSLSSS